MLTEKTGTGSNWEQFMQIKAQARMRNSGFAGKAAVKAPAATTSKAGRAFPAPASATKAIMHAGMYRSLPVVDHGKILGGKFDAWA